MLFSPCCWSCGQTGHCSRDCQDPKGVVEARNTAKLNSGTKYQPEAVLFHQEQISCWLTASPTAVRVAGMVIGHFVHLVVDLGPEKTFVGEDLVDVSSVPEATQQLCGVTGQCVTMWDSFMVNISMGSVLESLIVFVAALEDPCLLGD
ncbi:hypothetical protein E2C01_077514 [Portunus trituberculatus]|uniref:CCHC-type domain-containing protein n=1 Tax=Portunus trituberculatus TaxID=210409 RepID=A0A5B7IPW7_PORTR|nr:hypothetical protein [Portunus trituberculatus]